MGQDQCHQTLGLAVGGGLVGKGLRGRAGRLNKSGRWRCKCSSVVRLPECPSSSAASRLCDLGQESMEGLSLHLLIGKMGLL